MHRCQIAYIILFTIHISELILSTINYCRSHYSLYFNDENDPEVYLYGLYRINFVDVVTKRTYISNEFLSNYGQRKFEAGEIELGQYLTNNNVDIASDKVVEILKSLTPQDQLIYIEGLNRLNGLVHQGYKESFTRTRKEEREKTNNLRNNDSFIDRFGRN